MVMSWRRKTTSVYFGFKNT